ncbi:ATP-grasp domain-containing protein [Chromobacterium alticapitis]|uniref:ATP-grasp domain-containing protein n=1 Tax=Chromobacterium alticapitis TaxID=2073169 RepID=A0A2S5DG37_9NEIS|nr:hypothetical protein [Chromobacterium alticapitis]POZ62055.1 hypothetical protein C2I19_10380 [Chromobacterium alticapitis]
MRALLLAPPKIILQNSSADWASATGGDAVLFTDAAEREAIVAHAGSAFAEIRFFKDFNNNGLVEKQALDMHRAAPFRNVIALAESDVLRAARLRQKWNLGGLTPADAVFFRDKFEMKKRARAAGVPVADFQLSHTPLDLLDFIGVHGYPIVVKPVDGRGSSGVQVLRDEAMLESYLESGAAVLGKSPLTESFVPGEMYQANGLYLDGKLVLLSCVQCVHSNLEFLNGEWLGLKMLDPAGELWGRLDAFATDLLQRVLPMPPNGLFHIEIFHTPDGQLYLCEAACRLAGCLANDQIRHAFGIDVRMEYIRSECGYPQRLTTERPRPAKMIAELNIPPRPALLRSLPGQAPQPWVAFYKRNASPGQEYRKMAFTNGEIASLLITGADEAELAQRLQQAATWFERETIWD